MKKISQDGEDKSRLKGQAKTEKKNQGEDQISQDGEDKLRLKG